LLLMNVRIKISQGAKEIKVTVGCPNYLMTSVFFFAMEGRGNINLHLCSGTCCLFYDILCCRTCSEFLLHTYRRPAIPLNDCERPGLEESPNRPFLYASSCHDVVTPFSVHETTFHVGGK
ncbi:hypothetical protein L9F63_023843, partial [Diploptera punctata]